MLFVHQEKFGRLPRGARLERIKKSPHYDGKKFVNELETVKVTNEKGIVAVWSDFLLSKKSHLMPDHALPVIKTNLKALKRDRDWIVWFGHSSYLINLSGKTVLVDPVFYQGAPVRFANRMFKGTDYYKPEMMPDIDYLLISHDHWDHLDYQTVTELKSNVGRVITGLGVGEHFEYWKYPKEKLTELDWWESADLGDGFEVTATPARHYSGRNLKLSHTLWASFLFKTPRRSVWMGGDTGYGPHFAKIGQKYPGIDLAILENGQYNKDWAQVHTLPDQLPMIMEELGAARYLTVHHSKFCLSKHPYDEPLENAKKAAEISGKPVLMPQIGEVLYLE